MKKRNLLELACVSLLLGGLEGCSVPRIPIPITKQCYVNHELIREYEREERIDGFYEEARLVKNE